MLSWNHCVDVLGHGQGTVPFVMECYTNQMYSVSEHTHLCVLQPANESHLRAPLLGVQSGIPNAMDLGADPVSTDSLINPLVVLLMHWLVDRWMD